MQTTAEGVIVVAVYQPRPDLLMRQIDSIKGQTLAEWKCLVGIDGYDADTFELVQNCVGDDPRFVLRHYSDRAGFYHNFERLLHEIPTSAPWVALSDQDDNWYPSKLAILVPHLKAHQLVTGQARVVHEPRPGNLSVPGDHPITTNRSMNGLMELFVDNSVTGSISIFRGELLQSALPFPPKTDVAFHDHWLGICAAINGGLLIVPNVVQDYIQHCSNVIGEEKPQQLRARFSRLQESANRKGLMGQMQYLADHRWGWRVAMAASALAQSPVANPYDRMLLSSIAGSTLSFRLLAKFVRLLALRTAPKSRVLGQVVGYLYRSLGNFRRNQW